MISPINTTPDLPTTWRVYTAPQKQKLLEGHYARRVVAVGAQTISGLKDARGNDHPPGEVPAGFEHSAVTSEITATGTVIAYF